MVPPALPIKSRCAGSIAISRSASPALLLRWSATPAHCTSSASTKAIASPSSPTTVWTMRSDCLPAGGSARSRPSSMCALSTSLIIILPITRRPSSYTRTIWVARCALQPRACRASSTSSAWTGRRAARKVCPSSWRQTCRRRPIRPTKAPSRISPTRPARPASRRARASRTSRPCARAIALPSGYASRLMTYRSAQPRSRAHTNWSATCCRHCNGVRPSMSWESGRNPRASMH